MPSAYTDEERARRYGELKERKKWLDRAYALSMWIALGLALLMVLPTIYFSFMSGVFLFKIKGPAIDLVLILLINIMQVLGIGARKWKFTLASGAAQYVTDIIGVTLVGIQDIFRYFTIPTACLTAFVFACHAAEHKLSQEEGYPDFNISMEEHQQKQKQAEAQHRYRMLQEEVTAEAGTVRDMTDLLDDAQRTMPQTLTGYQERHTLHAKTAGREYVPGEMDEL